LESKPVFAIGPSATAFGVPSGVLVAAEIATTWPWRWSSSVSWRNVLPGRSWPKNMATKTVSSASLASPLFVTATARGEVPKGLRSTVAMTAFVAVSMTDRLLEAALATYSRVPFGDSATPMGSAPTAMVLVTLSVVRLSTDTEPLNALATYVRTPSG
jgi:hypothetical protein